MIKANSTLPTGTGIAGGKTKILLLITSSAGGVGRHSYYLAKYLPREEFALTIAYGPGYPLDAAIEDLGLPVAHLSISRGLSAWHTLRASLQLYQLLKRERFDIICVGCSIAAFIGRTVGALAGVPQRVFITHVFATQSAQSPFRQRLFRLLERGLDRLTTHYVAVCEASKAFGIEHDITPPSKVTVIHNGIALGPIVDVEPAYIRDLGLDPQRPIVGTTARLEPQKGIEDLICALPVLCREVPGVQAVIAGDGPLRARLEALARQRGVDDRLHFIGWRDDIPQILRSLDVFCLPSHYEMFPYSVLEALALECPVVATAVDGVPELIQDGQTGRLVPPSAPAALAAALTQSLCRQEETRRMAMAGRRLVAQRYSVERMADGYATLFRRLRTQ